MMEELTLNQELSKTERYRLLHKQAKALLMGETNEVAYLANMAAVLKQGLKFFWVGFYLVNENQLVLGPFQGDVACTRISFGKGVCGTAWKEKKTLIVPNVDEFPGHIACSSASRSEIVIPIYKNEKVVAVLDVDSTQINAFDAVDEKWLTKFAGLCQSVFKHE